MKHLDFNSKNKLQGFTLLELLVVIAIIAILSVVIVLILNPSESLKRSRDAARISDLTAIKKAMSVYVTSTSTPFLGGNATNGTCKPTPATSFGVSGTFKIWYSLPSTSAITDTTLDTGTTVTNASQVTLANIAKVDSTGWIPVNLDSLTGGSPISNFPIDPINTITNLASVASTDLVYRYACSQNPLSFEVDATLESTGFTISDPKMANDGGDSNLYYEAGTNLKILTGSVAQF